MTGKVESITEAVEAVNTQDVDRSLNLVFRKLPETVNENLNKNLNHIIENYLKVNDVSVSSARRIINPDGDSLKMYLSL